ncbi:MAG TPA: LssY C-terminal domain-containing protein [Verrucomicrobiae bacterium]|nr:LssY C-terminal domain-containing protein [Verrucomicrobiae bacterium]
MFGLVFRLLWRLLVFIIAVVTAYATFFLLVPILDGKIPLLGILIIIYIWIAYVAIPGLMRVWRIAIKPNHIPLYATTSDGWPSDPVNIAVVCRSEKQLIRSMEAAGWTIADKVTLKSAVIMAWATIFNRPYPAAPFSSLYLFGRRQDIGFQIQEGTPPTPRHRHHIRLWRLSDEHQPHAHQSFWEKVFRGLVQGRREIWIGAATHDIGPFAIRMRNFQITHQIDSDTERERDFVISTLQAADKLRDTTIVTAGEQLAFRGQTFGVNIITDGTLKVVQLGQPLFSKLKK